MGTSASRENVLIVCRKAALPLDTLHPVGHKYSVKTQRVSLEEILVGAPSFPRSVREGGDFDFMNLTLVARTLLSA
jgi:hypothetical protein